MGRPTTNNDDLPPFMRKRVRTYGTYYFLDTGATPRKEVPLGKDFVSALRKYSAIMEKTSGDGPRTFGDAISRYRTQELPTKSVNTIRVMTTDLKYLEAYFGDAPMDEIRPMHIRSFLDKHQDKPTTANRCKRVFSAVWNVARGWGYTDLPAPSAGIMGYGLGKRQVYITDEVYHAVRAAATEELCNAMDLAYLTGQRPSDTLRMTDEDIVAGHLIVDQGKTRKKLRIVVTGELATLLARIAVRKVQHQVNHRYLLMNRHNAPLTPGVLRGLFKRAKHKAALDNPTLEAAIKAFWFYDLRAKAADDVGDARGAQDATDLLGHDSQRTTNRHYRRRGTIVLPTR